jgi:hypothetical protein
MTTLPARARRSPQRGLKSPLAVASPVRHSGTSAESPVRTSAPRARLSDRESTIAEFEDYLRTANNRDGRPYKEKTISVRVAWTLADLNGNDQPRPMTSARPGARCPRATLERGSSALERGRFSAR